MHTKVWLSRKMLSVCLKQSLENIFKQKNLQQQLSDAKLEEANMLLKDAEEKHKREKEYVSHTALFISALWAEIAHRR